MEQNKRPDQSVDAGAISATPSFPLLRRLSITSLVSMLITAAILVFLYRQDQFAEHENIAAQENEKTAIHLSHLLDDRLDALVAATNGLDTQALRGNPHVDALTAALKTVREHHVLKLKIYDLSGTTVYSPVKEEIGAASKHTDWLAEALRGETAHRMEFRDTLLGPAGKLRNRYIAITYMPLTHAGKRIGAIEIDADATPIIKRIYSRTISIALIVLGAFAALYAALFFSVFRTDRAVAKWQKTIADNAQKLAASEQRFRDVSDAAGEYLWEIDANMVYTYVSNRSVDVKGYSPEELLGHTPLEFMPDEDIAPVSEIVKRAIANKAPFKLQHRDITKTGAVLWEEVNGVPFYDKNGTVIGLRGAGLNITGRKQFELVMRESEERLRAAIETSMDAAVQIDAEGIITGWSRQAEEIFGWLRTEAVGRAIHETIIPPQHRDAHVHGMTHFLRTGEGPILRKRIETVGLHRDGHEIAVELTVAPIKMGGKQEFSAFIRDITGSRLIEAQREQFRKFFMLSIDPLCIAGPDGFFKKVNPAFSTLLGFSEKEFLEKPYLEFIHPDDREATQEEVRRQLQGGVTLNFSNRYLCKNGSIRWLAWTAYMNKDDGLLYASAHDFTERKESEEALVKSEALLKHTQQLSKVGGWKYDVATKKLSWTDEVYRIYEVGDDYDPNNITQDISFYALPDQAVIENAFKQVVETGRPYDLELQFTGAKGAQKWVRTTAQAEQISGRVMSVFGNIMDITDRKKAEEIIWKQANFDLLTGLPNRRMFRDRLEQEIRKAHRSGLPLALLFVDLDHFNEINDTLGHSMGDVLLMEAARRIGGCLRATDIMARMGGDEFAVILVERGDISSIDLITRSILQKMSEPIQLGSELVHTSASIGITLYPDDATEIEGLLKNADQAMYAAKNAGRNRHSYFTHSMQESARGKLRLINDLRNAVGANQLMVYFQPIINLSTGQIYKAEALVRWQHPERGMVSPIEFIPLAEETGLIFEIGDWVFHESTRWVKRWRELHSPDFQVSVNKSPVQFYKNSDEHSGWLNHLKHLGLPGQSITIEITEGLLLNAEPVITGALLTYRDAGIQVSIDDFGTGYSSLSYLKKFDIDYLKIDQSFTRNLSPGSSDMALSEAIIVMAHKLGFKVIAEGVETEQQRDLLIEAGCDYAQGYLYSKPISPDDFETLLGNHR